MTEQMESLVPSRIWLRLIEILALVVIAVAISFAWRADQRDRAQLASELAATKQLLAAADARQRDRDVQLNQTLAALAVEKRAVATPQQIIRELPRKIPLPAPLVLQTSPATTVTSSQTAEGRRSASGLSPANNAKPAQAQAVIPVEDLRPLYDFTLDCKACQAKLSTAQGDLTDEKAKTTALTKERDQALQIARGGSAWRRIGRAAKWFLIGAAAGAVAAKAAH